MKDFTRPVYKQTLSSEPCQEALSMYWATNGISTECFWTRITCFLTEAQLPCRTTNRTSISFCVTIICSLLWCHGFYLPGFVSVTSTIQLLRSDYLKQFIVHLRSLLNSSQWICILLSVATDHKDGCGFETWKNWANQKDDYGLCSLIKFEEQYPHDIAPLISRIICA